MDALDHVDPPRDGPRPVVVSPNHFRRPHLEFALELVAKFPTQKAGRQDPRAGMRGPRRRGRWSNSHPLRTEPRATWWTNTRARSRNFPGPGLLSASRLMNMPADRAGVPSRNWIGGTSAGSSRPNVPAKAIAAKATEKTDTPAPHTPPGCPGCAVPGRGRPLSVANEYSRGSKPSSTPPRHGFFDPSPTWRTTGTPLWQDRTHVGA